MSRAYDEVLTLHPPRLSSTATALGSVAFTVGAIALLDPDGGTLSLVGTALAVIVFGSLSVSSIWQLIPGRGHYMRIAPDGLAFKGMWRTSHQAWNEIDRFVAFDVRAFYSKRRLVGYILRETDAGRPSRRRFGRGLLSVDSVVPDTYGRDADELAALLQDYRDKYASS